MRRNLRPTSRRHWMRRCSRTMRRNLRPTSRRHWMRRCLRTMRRSLRPTNCHLPRTTMTTPRCLKMRRNLPLMNCHLPQTMTTHRWMNSHRMTSQRRKMMSCLRRLPHRRRRTPASGRSGRSRVTPPGHGRQVRWCSLSALERHNNRWGCRHPARYPGGRRRPNPVLKTRRPRTALRRQGSHPARAARSRAVAEPPGWGPACLGPPPCPRSPAPCRQPARDRSPACHP